MLKNAECLTNSFSLMFIFGIWFTETKNLTIDNQ